MANSIALAKNYVELLDEVYKNASLTANLIRNDGFVRAGANANEVLVPKISMSGQADYSRNSGYVKGDVTVGWETLKFNYDRGRLFEVDSMDDEETIGVAFGMLGAEYIRTKVVPEVDAFTFATLAGATGISSTSGTISTGADAMDAIKTANDQMDNDEVTANRILYATPAVISSIQAMDTTKSRELLGAFSAIVKVPQSRFYTAIDLYDGTTSGEEAGGYVKHVSTGVSDEAGKNINFVIVEPSAVVKFSKRIVGNIITPEANQSSDGYIQKFREYDLCDVLDNKVAGIYVHHVA